MSARKLVNIRVDAELWRKAKVQAAVEGKTLQEWIEDAIRSRLALEPVAGTDLRD